METLVWMEEYMSEAEEMIFNGRVDEGLNVLRSLLFEEPGYGSLHNYLGWAYMYHANDPERAELHFRMAIRFAADYAPPYLHMGNLLNRAARYSEALEYFRTGLTKPEAIRLALLEGMGYAHELLGEYGAAMRSYRQAATTSAIDSEVERVMKGVRRCRRKRIATFFSFW
ncbi:MAG TPA: hypothetical protein VEB86_12580 [Chryseosolibacter sp.]|nr:hypothetical protein [Chryseosolibacter sp.]